MATKRILIMTTTASEADTSAFSAVTGITAVSTEPDGTSVKIVTKVADTWQKYDAAASAWKDVATQSLTAASVASDGNSVTEINAIPASALTDFKGRKVNFAIAYTTTSSSQPSLKSITISGEASTIVPRKEIVQPAIALGGVPVDILRIEVDKTELNGGKANVLASINTDNDEWTKYQDYKKYLTSPPTKAKNIAFKYVLEAPTPGESVAKINSVEVRHRTDDVSIVADGTTSCITKTYDLGTAISKADVAVKHKIVKDTAFAAYVSIGEKPSVVKGEVADAGTGAVQTYKVAHAKKLASHGFALYFNGDKQDTSTYSFSPNDGLVTFKASAGDSITVDYIYNWEQENWTPMESVGTYTDETNKDEVTEQFAYVAGDGRAMGSVVTVRIDITQNSGSAIGEELGIGNGAPQAIALAHHAKKGSINIIPESTKWKFYEKTNVVVMTAPKGEKVMASYDWVARTNYIDSLVCVFNE